MRILFLGDVMGRAGRDAVAQYLPQLKEKLKPDVVIINGENAAHGRGITGKICKDFYEMGADCVTTGNHVWDQNEIISYIDGDPKLLRPINFPKGTPGRGAYTHTLTDGRKILVINAMGRLFMDPMDDPFAIVTDFLKSETLGATVNAIFVDFHAETTSEKMCLAHHLDGKVSVVVGTHTHMPTADTQILDGGTAFQTDAGMCGDYNSVIGVAKHTAIPRFTRKMMLEKMVPAEGEGTVCGMFVITDDKTGHAKAAAAVRVGPRLSESIPEGLAA